MTALDKQKNTFAFLKEKFHYTNIFEAPRVEKIIVSTGIGSTKDKRKLDIILDRLSKITGQKPLARTAKKSIATFKLREGDVVGYQITLRGPRMLDFLDKLIHIALPRTRDFRGVPRTSIDEMGNVTIGIKEHTIFPEASDEELRDVFGLSVTIGTSARTKEEAAALFESLGLPLQKE
ncbi:50S ribosomal protein L5 [Candidatus Kaiserbacteria bacterium]|nr:50S ribosomal protein L5 [Candidatus Kaiserbacteria bacterium]